jgi:hypothetical protein
VMRLTRRGRRVVGFFAIVGSIAIVVTIALIPPGWWM